MKCLAVLGAISFLMLALAVPASAAICNIDVAPAATLLLPYFIVGTTSPHPVTTQYTVINTGPAPAIAR